MLDWIRFISHFWMNDVMKTKCRMFPMMMILASLILGCVVCAATADEVPQPKTVPQPIIQKTTIVESIGVAYPPKPLKNLVANPVQAVKNVVDAKMHSHTCPNGHTWSHSDHSFGNRADHMCPVCGAGPVWNQNAAKVKAPSVTEYIFKSSSGGCPGGVCPVPRSSSPRRGVFRR